MASRTELKRQYKEQQPTAGVFTITNKQNQKVLLGSSKNLHGPLNKHRFVLAIGAHQNSDLQSDWKALGEDAFSFEIVAVVHPVPESPYELEAALSELEQRWLEKLQPLQPNGYNLNARIRE